MSRHVKMVVQAKAYLAYRRTLGFELRSAGLVLLEFARFADRTGHCGPLTSALALRWATKSERHSARYRRERLSIVRGFARYLAAEDGLSQVPDMRLLAAGPRRQQPHIYTERQLHDLVAAAAKLPAVYPLRPRSYATLFGLLASTGLRISEAVNLLRSDVDLDRGVLHIRQTKFHKERLVPMHTTTIQAMRCYAKRRDSDRSPESSLAFFIGRNRQPLPYTTVRCTFRRLCNQLQLRSNGVLPLPRIHDLRHTFACRRLSLWQHHGGNLDHKIASLSTYLGHGKISDTYWYLSGTGELLSIAGKQFERSVQSARKQP